MKQEIQLFLIVLLFTGSMAPVLAAANFQSKLQAAEASSSTEVLKEEMRLHVIAANADGLVISPTNRHQVLSSDEFVEQIDALLISAERLADKMAKLEPEQSTDATGRTVVKLMIHIHGGLNGPKSTEDRVERFTWIIKNDTTNWHYPIFIQWPSTFLGTYGERLTSVRNGNKVRSKNYVTAPLWFVSDLMQGVARVPQDVYYQFVNAKDRMATTRKWLDPHLSSNWEIAANNYQQITNGSAGASVCTNVYRGNYKVLSTEQPTRLALEVVQVPVRTTIGTLGQGTISQASWKNMKRRTSNMLYPVPLTQAINAEDAEDIQRRAAGYFFEHLIHRIEANKAQYAYEITFVGHSMGTIVLNKVFTKYRDAWIRSRAMRNIVYMGAACSISDGIDALTPLLTAYNSQTNSLRFYNLSLSRVAEVAERNVWGLAPTGSLLEYIDQHLENPDAMIDRTMGWDVNVLQSIHAFTPIKNFCELKSFDRCHVPVDGRSVLTIPSKHGEFNLSPFWREEFWNKDTFYTYKSGQSEKTTIKANSYPKNWLEFDPIFKKLEQLNPEVAKSVLK